MRSATDHAAEAVRLESALESERTTAESLRHELHEAEGQIACLEGDLSAANAEIRELKSQVNRDPVIDRQTAAQEFDDLFSDPAQTDPYEARREAA